MVFSTAAVAACTPWSVCESRINVAGVVDGVNLFAVRVGKPAVFEKLLTLGLALCELFGFLLGGGTVYRIRPMRINPVEELRLRKDV